MTRADEIEKEKWANDDRLIRQVRWINAGLILILVALVAGPLYLQWQISQQYPRINTVSIEAAQVIGEAELCPGDPLVIEYRLDAIGQGMLLYDASVWQITPPKTVIFSTSRRFILEEPINQLLVETWHVPDSYINPATDQVTPLAAGQYRRVFAISSPSNSLIIAVASVDFAIRADCQI